MSFKCEADGSSGVYIRTAFDGDKPRIVAGCQIEIDRPSDHHMGGIYVGGKGWIAWRAPPSESVIRTFDWNHTLIALQLHSVGEGPMRLKDIYIRDLRRGDLTALCMNCAATVPSDCPYCRAVHSAQPVPDPAPPDRRFHVIGLGFALWHGPACGKEARS